jgi:hypothetical protein
MPIMGGGSPTGGPIFRNREVFVWENGAVRRITTRDELVKYLESLPPEEYERFKTQYRFEPVRNNTNNPYYTGSIRDLL